MFENVDGRTTDGRRTTDAGVTGILIAHLGAFGSGELKTVKCCAMIINSMHASVQQSLIRIQTMLIHVFLKQNFE